MKNPRMMIMLASVMACLSVHGAAQASATWPSQSVRIVVPFPPGGAADFAARLIGERLGTETGQSFVVENRAGASGTIGAQAAARAEPNGHTILLSSPAEVLIGKIAGQKTSYDPDTDLTPVTLVGDTPLVVVTNPQTGLDSFQDLLEWAKSGKAEVSYGTPGNASPQHFAGESINLAGAVKMLHIPYRGAALVTNDLLGNQIPVAVLGMPPVVEQHRAGRLKILAVTSEKRSNTLPDVASVSEVPGFSDYSFTNWFGVYVPSGTPQATVEQIAERINGVLGQEDIAAKLRDQGMEALGTTPAQFREFLDGQKQKYRLVQQQSGIRIE